MTTFGAHVQVHHHSKPNPTWGDCNGGCDNFGLHKTHLLMPTESAQTEYASSSCNQQDKVMGKDLEKQFVVLYILGDSYARDGPEGRVENWEVQSHEGGSIISTCGTKLGICQREYMVFHGPLDKKTVAYLQSFLDLCRGQVYEDITMSGRTITIVREDYNHLFKQLYGSEALFVLKNTEESFISISKNLICGVPVIHCYQVEETGLKSKNTYDDTYLNPCQPRNLVVDESKQEPMKNKKGNKKHNKHKKSNKKH